MNSARHRYWNTIKSQSFRVQRKLGLLNISDDFGEYAPDPKSHRIVNLQSSQSKKFCSNHISTTKYSWWNFLFKFLWEQFRRAANLFFLLISLLQQIPNVSPTGQFTTLGPLVVILTITAVKEILEDVARWRADKSLNEASAVLLKNSQRIQWRKIRVGDFLRIYPGDFIPADCVILWTEDGSPCHIVTANLDGETNVKERRSPATSIVNIKAIPKSLDIRCDLPNKSIYKFSGMMKVNGSEEAVLANDNVVLRGCQLAKSSVPIVAFVVYNGPETKVALNTGVTPLKRSQLDKATNKQILAMFFVLLVLAFISLVGSNVHDAFNGKPWYMSSTSINQFLSFITFFILYNNLVPISLLVTVELVKAQQASFINNDLKLYYAKTDTPAVARTSNLNEQLGQINTVFSDKTGTLTCNMMVLTGITVLRGSLEGNDDNACVFRGETLSDVKDQLENVQFNELHQLLSMLSACNTVSTIGGSYQAESPDELAFAEGACVLDYKLLGRRTDADAEYIEYVHNGKTYKVAVLRTIPFDSDRKRMSMVVQYEDKSTHVWCKGADEVLRPLLKRPLSSAIYNEMVAYSREGLRTLLFTQREISLDEIKSLDENDAKAAAVIERDLIAIGASAVEDALQDGVKDTIIQLRNAGISVWMLTGDKAETAEQIARSVGLIKRTAPVYTIHDSQWVSGTIGDDAGLLIKGDDALELINNPEWVRRAQYVGGVIACRLSPNQKADIVRAIQVASCGKGTLAIGDGANDVAMIQAADIGVGIRGLEGLQATLASDYALPQFKGLARLLLVHGAWNYSRICKVIHYCFYKNLLLYFINFLFQFSNGFSGQPCFERWTLAGYNIAFTFFPPILLGFFERSCEDKSHLQYGDLYRTSQEGLLFDTRTFWLNILNAIFHSAVIYCVAGLVCEAGGINFLSIHVDGVFGYGTIIYLAVVIVANIKLLLIMDTWNMPVISFSLLSIFIYFVWLIMSSYWMLLPFMTFSVADATGLFTNMISSLVFWFSAIILIPVCCLSLDVFFKMIEQNFIMTFTQIVRTFETEFENEYIGGAVLDLAAEDTPSLCKLFNCFQYEKPPSTQRLQSQFSQSTQHTTIFP